MRWEDQRPELTFDPPPLEQAMFLNGSNSPHLLGALRAFQVFEGQLFPDRLLEVFLLAADVIEGSGRVVGVGAAASAANRGKGATLALRVFEGPGGPQHRFPGFIELLLGHVPDFSSRQAQEGDAFINLAVDSDGHRVAAVEFAGSGIDRISRLEPDAADRAAQLQHLLNLEVGVGAALTGGGDSLELAFLHFGEDGFETGCRDIVLEFGGGDFLHQGLEAVGALLVEVSAEQDLDPPGAFFQVFEDLLKGPLPSLVNAPFVMLALVTVEGDLDPLQAVFFELVDQLGCQKDAVRRHSRGKLYAPHQAKWNQLAAEDGNRYN